MGKYIHLNYFGMTVFDDYFKYLEEIKDRVAKDIYDFFSDEERYFLHGDKTFHDAWIVKIQYSIKEKCFTHIDEKLYDACLTLVNAKWDKLFLLKYKNAKIHAFPCNLPYSDFFRLDLLYHELTWNDVEKNYQHTLYFDDEKYIRVIFANFEYSESTFAPPDPT